MEDAGGERGLDARVREHVDKVLRRARAAARDDGDAHGRADHAQQLRVESGARPVAVDAVHEELARAEARRALRELHDGQRARLAPARHRALVPPRLARVGRAGRAVHERVRARVRRGVDERAARVDGDDDGLAAVRSRDALDRARAVRHPATREQPLDRAHRVRADADLVRARAEVRGGDLARGARRAVGVRGVRDPAADGERDVDRRGGGAHDREHRLVAQRRVPEGRDVQQAQLVRAPRRVPRRERDGLAEVPHRAARVRGKRARRRGGRGAGRVGGGGGGSWLLAHVVLVALGHDEVARVVRAHVHGHDDALREPVLRRGRACNARRGRRAPALGLGRAQPRIEDAQARGAGLFGVELRAEDGPAADGRHEHVLAVLRGRVRPLRRGGVRAGGVRRAERVHEVEVRAVGDARVGAVEKAHGVPAHVRDGLVRVVEGLDRARDHAQPARCGGLSRGLVQDLHADADPEVRAARVHVFAQRREQAFCFKVLHRGLERAYSREDQALAKYVSDVFAEIGERGGSHRRLVKVFRGRDPFKVVPEPAQRVGKALNVACAVVEEV
jgi:hypothetical protein